MLSIKARLRKPVLDKNGYKNALAQRALDNITQAAFVWVATAVELIPVWSGASRATFEKLAADISLQIENQPKQGVPDNRGEGRLESEGGIVNDPASGIFGFSYGTTLDHLLFNEIANANEGGDPNVFAKLLKPGPYNFVEEANSAARPVLQDFIPPRLDTFISVRSL